VNTHNIEDIYELSPLQEGILFHSLYEPNLAVYCEQLAFDLPDAINVAALESAWQSVVDRHTILRTSFHWEDGKPLQIVHRSARLPFFVEELPEEKWEARLAEDRGQPFDLTQTPLMRLVLVHTVSGYRVIFTIHHLLLDGWSTTLVCQEAAALYEAYCRGETLDLGPSRPFVDYIAWLQGQDLQKAEAFWRQELAGYTGAPPLPVGHATGEGNGYDVVQDTISAATTESMRGLTSHHQLTLNTLVQGAWAVLLSRYMGVEDVVFGATVSGRPAALEGVESMVGLFINTLPVRVRVTPEARIIPWLRDLQARQFAARQYEYAPLARVQAWSDAPHGKPLFETLLGFENFPAGARQNGAIAQPRYSGSTNYPLNVIIWPGAAISIKVMYERSRSDSDSISRLIGHLRTLLEAVIQSPEGRIGDLALVTEPERLRVAEWNAVRTGYPRDSSVHELFERRVAAAPDEPAVHFDDERLTYAELNRRANSLAHRLRDAGVGPGSLVAISIERSASMVIGVLSILKAGGAYVPLDGEYPEERLAWMLQDCGARVVVTAGRQRLSHTSGLTVLAVDGEESDIDPGVAVSAESLAYVMYTSGSTGTPKGVAVPHRAVIRTVCDTNYISLDASHNIAQLSNFSFDAATFEIWGALLNGGRLTGIAREVALSPNEFAAVLRRERITTVFLTTDLFNQIVSARPDAFQTLRELLVGGSAANPKWFRECLQNGAPARFLHVYGPTESTVFATWHLVREVPADAETVPIGGPLSNTEVYVLDATRNLLPIGVPGELYIDGDGLARGYLNQPELTAEKFGNHLYRTGDRVRYLSDGSIEYLGRFDDQVKIRGFRVEPGEIEAALRRQPDVRECVVLAKDKRLVAYVVSNRPDTSATGLRNFLEKSLPEYMLPASFALLDSLPLNPNGKVNRSALMEPDHARPRMETAYLAPGTPEEKILAEIWAELLGVDRVGIHDNFFELGGDSIISIQVIARARESGLQLTLKQVFKHQTIAALAAVAGVEPSISADQGLLTGDIPLTPVQRWFFEQELVEPAHFNQAALLVTPAGIDSELLARAVRRVLEHHDALRLRFVREEAGWRQFYSAPDANAPYECLDCEEDVEQRAAEIQACLDLAAGPLLRVAYFPRVNRLLFVIHHLAVDSVSWRILMEDFWKAYAVAELPSKTASFQQWSRRLQEYALSPEVRKELPYWQSIKNLPIPVDFRTGANTVASARTVSVSLSAEETRALLHDVPAVYGTQINDVLLTALAQAFAQWTGAPELAIHLEGHGREPLFEDIDLSRTIGWFTTIYPVRLELSTDHPGEALKSIKEQLRAIPNRGVGYGLLGLKAPQPDVGFNYLGQVAGDLAPESSGAPRSPFQTRNHLIEIDASVTHGKLHIDWAYSENHHRRSTIERVAAAYLASLWSLIVHCLSPDAGGYTPSDFAAARISKKDLEKLLTPQSRSS
jgi:amino acid adenylation domain-containing protein/non-ribosomal peptide synthase protein (TIGR01720 family)